MTGQMKCDILTTIADNGCKHRKLACASLLRISLPLTLVGCQRLTSKSACLFASGTTYLHRGMVSEPDNKWTNLFPLRRKQRLLRGLSSLTKPFENYFQREWSHLVPVVKDFLKSPDGTLVTSFVAGTVALLETARASRPPGDWVSFMVCEGRDGVVPRRMNVEVIYAGVCGPLLLQFPRVWVYGSLQGGRRP